MFENGLRRLITGETPVGKSYVVSEERVSPRSISGLDLYSIWGALDLPLSLPGDGGDTAAGLVHGIVRTAVGVIPPRTLVGAKDPGHLEYDADGFHRTDSVDVAFVVDGEIVMRVPGEPPIVLKRGECVVQVGALHSWENQSDQPATIFWTWLKGSRRESSGGG